MTDLTDDAIADAIAHVSARLDEWERSVAQATQRASLDPRPRVAATLESRVRVRDHWRRTLDTLTALAAAYEALLNDPDAPLRSPEARAALARGIPVTTRPDGTGCWYEYWADDDGEHQGWRVR